ncbi:MAG: CotH kinase family protein, partial [Cyclonatronaceae bacterium]
MMMTLGLVCTSVQAQQLFFPKESLPFGLPSEVITADSTAVPQELEQPEFSLEPGFYEEAITLEIQSIHEGSQLRYTTDGSLPTRESPLYEGPLLLESRAGEPNDIFLIPTNAFDDSHPYQEQWQEPQGEVFKIHTVRARIFPEDESLEPGPVLSGSFIIDDAGAARFSMPVVSLSTDREALFGDEQGIYVPGDGSNGENYDQRGRDWEREAFMEVFEKDGTPALQLPVGLRIHGGTSRARPRKSLRIYSRSDYGETWMNYPFFPDKNIGQYKRLLLRNGGNDWGKAIIRDGFMQSLLRGLNLDMQHFRPAIVFINGEYWGIHNIRDRLDDRYLETHYGLEEEEITILEGNASYESGDPAGVVHYHQMRSFLNNTGVSTPENYAELQTRMDTENFADYQIAQIYFANTDWPGNNIKYWRANRPFDPDAPRGQDGRWRWMVYDTDFGFNLDYDYVIGVDDGPAHNTLRFALHEDGNNWPNPSWSTFILRKLLENETFKAAFINQAADLLNTRFRAEYALAELDSMAALYAPEIAEHSARWVRPSQESWENQLERMRDFAAQRAGFMRQHFLDEFDIGSGTETITLHIEDENQGYIQVNRTDLRPETPGVRQEGSVYPWSGDYFDGLEIRLKAVPRSGYAFAGWEGSYSSEEAEISILPEQATDLTATFVPDDGSPAPDLTPWEFSTAGDYQFTEWTADAAAGSYPAAMKFYQTADEQPDPGLETLRDEPWSLPYDLDNRSRINGLGAEGV